MEPSEDLLRGLLAAAPDALLAVDAGGRIVFANDRAQRLFDWPVADLVGRPVECLVPERFAGGHPVLRQAYTARPTARPMGAGLELRARRRDGSEFPAEISLNAFTTTHGPLVAAAVRDVSESRRVEQRLRAVLASAPDAIIGISAGRIELVNEQAERLFGWRADELIGSPAEVLVSGGAFDESVRERARAMRDPDRPPTGGGLQLDARRKDGTVFAADVSVSVVTDDPGAELTLAAIRDASGRNRREAAQRREALAEQRERTDRLASLGQLAGGIAHDFNNLLGVILNYTSLVTRQVAEPAARSDLAEIRAAAERAASLTRQLLTFARRDVVDAEPLDVNDVVRGVAAMLARTLGEHIELRLDLTEEPLIAVADRHQLDQIVLNLAINSRDAMPNGGAVTIATRALSTLVGHSQVVLTVADTGLGMSADVVDRVFEPFFSTKPTGEGTGLGLSTVYGIVQQNGGDVTIDSTPQQGTTVTVVLPGAVAPAAQPASGERAVDGGGERILLVEDEPALRAGTARLLASRGYTVLVAGDGVEALEVMDREERPIDVVVTDVAMPRMRGDELAAHLAERAPTLPVIYVSGYDSGGPPPTGRLLPKPVAEHDLLEVLREVLDG